MSGITGSFSTVASGTLKYDLHTIDMAFSPNGGTAIADGLTVSLNTSGNLVAATATSFPIGTVISFDKVRAKNVVRTPFYEHKRAVIKGGSVQAGALVALNGNSENGLVCVATAVATNFVYGVVLVGGAENATIEIGVVFPFKLSPTA